MKFLLAAICASAVPLPAGPPNLQKWIKINEVEYPVPAGMHPETFRQQLSSAGVAPRVEDHYLPYSAPSYPRPAFTTQFSGVGYASQVQAVPVTPTYATISTPTYQQYHYQQQPVNYWTNTMMNSNNGGRQWVKLREGTDPIEVPAGLDPQMYLDGIRAGARRYLSEQAEPRELRKQTKMTVQPVPDQVVSKTTSSQSKMSYYAMRGSNTPVIVDSGSMPDLTGAYVPVTGPSVIYGSRWKMLPAQMLAGGKSGIPSSNLPMLGGRGGGKNLQLHVGRMHTGKESMVSF